MPGKMARSDPRPSTRVTRGAGSGQHLASVLQEGRENANIDAGLGFIWRISVQRIQNVFGRTLRRTVTATSAPKNRARRNMASIRSIANPDRGCPSSTTLADFSRQGIHRSQPDG